MTVPLPDPGDTSWLDWATMVHNRVVDEGDPGTPSVRALGSDPFNAAPGVHTHTASQISDSTAIGRDILTADTAAEVLAVIEVNAEVEAVVFWDATNGWGSARPVGYKRVRWAANGSTTSTDPSLSLGQVGDIWERPA